MDQESMSRPSSALPKMCERGRRTRRPNGLGDWRRRNIFRGVAASAKGMDRASSDYMGMLATCINSLALQDALEKAWSRNARAERDRDGRDCRALHSEKKPFATWRRGEIVIFAAGMAIPILRTDTAAALRAMEINAEVILRPQKWTEFMTRTQFKHSDAVLYSQISYLDVLKQGSR